MLILRVIWSNLSSVLNPIDHLVAMLSFYKQKTHQVTHEWIWTKPKKAYLLSEQSDIKLVGRVECQQNEGKTYLMHQYLFHVFNPPLRVFLFSDSYSRRHHHIYHLLSCAWTFYREQIFKGKAPHQEAQHIQLLFLCKTHWRTSYERTVYHYSCTS